MELQHIVQKLRQELTCSICFKSFLSPTTLACGHNFCHACLVRYWGQFPIETACPQCQEKIPRLSFIPNVQLANITKLVEELSADIKQITAEGHVCQEHPPTLQAFCRNELVLFCSRCDLSREHLTHDVVPVAEAAQEYKGHLLNAMGTLENQKERISKHHSDEETQAGSLFEQIEKERQYVITEFNAIRQFLEEQENFLLLKVIGMGKGMLWEKAKHGAILFREVSAFDELIQTVKEKCQQSAVELLQLCTSTHWEQAPLVPLPHCCQILEAPESAHNSQMALPHLCVRCRSLVRALPSLQDWPMFLPTVRLCCQLRRPPADYNTIQEHLKDVGSTLKRCKETLMNPVTLPPWVKLGVWDLFDFNTFLGTLMKQFKDILVSGYQIQKANVTLDPDTAHPNLILSEDLKSCWLGRKSQNLVKDDKRFDLMMCVLGREIFITSRHYWDVAVENVGDWGVGVARSSMKRQGIEAFRNMEGVWVMAKCCGRFWVYINPPSLVSEPMRWEIKKIRVSLNYAGGRVAFCDVERGNLLYAFSGTSFSGEPIRPFFWIGKKTRLSLCP